MPGTEYTRSQAGAKYDATAPALGEGAEESLSIVAALAWSGCWRCSGAAAGVGRTRPGCGVTGNWISGNDGVPGDDAAVSRRVIG